MDIPLNYNIDKNPSGKQKYVTRVSFFFSLSPFFAACQLAQARGLAQARARPESPLHTFRSATAVTGAEDKE